MSDTNPITVYIAEDNPILLQGLERALTSNGYAVQTAVDGNSVVDLLEGPLPDILVLDVMMPGMTGLQVLETVRGNARTADLPVMLITAAAEELLPKSSLEQHRVDLLMKPFRLTELLSRIEESVASRNGKRRRDSGPPSSAAVMAD